MFGIVYGDHGWRRSVYDKCDAWYGAEVLLDGGWAHGTVVDVEPDGLVIDLGCDGMRRQLVRYGEVIRCSAADADPDELRAAYDAMRPGRAVEVLLRRDPRGPWVWRPATLVSADIPQREPGALALVELGMGGTALRRAVGAHQVRLPPSADALRNRVIPKGEFITIAYPLAGPEKPSNVWTRIPPGFRSNRMPAFSLREGQVFLLHRVHDWPCDDYDLEQHSWGLQATLEEFLQEGNALKEMDEGCRLPSACGSDEETDGSEWTLQSVHPHVLREMVTYLDTMERVILRRVCRGFDDLMSATLSADIRMTCRRCKLDGMSGSRGIELYAVAAPLLHCVSSRTRRITLIYAGVYGGSVSQILQLLGICRQLGLYAAGQRVLVLAGQCELGTWDDDGFWGDARVLAERMAGASCSQLLIKHCTKFTLANLTFTGSLHVSALQEGLGRLVERQLPTFDLQRTSEWLARAVHGELGDWRGFIWEALVLYAELDPRASNVYAGRDFNMYALAGAFDVAKLSRLAQYMLSRFVPPINGFDELPFAEGF